MDRFNHVKILSPDPEAVNRFLTEVLDVPAGWSIGPIVGAPAHDSLSPARDARGELTTESVLAFRGKDLGGVIVGTAESRQFQVLKSARAGSGRSRWGRATSSAAHERARAREIPCTDLDFTEWGEGGARVFLR